MQHNTLQFEGAWSFGESKRPKWYILKNKQIPGPGTYNQINIKNAPNWSMGTQQKRPSFIQINNNIDAGSYNLNHEIISVSSIKYSIGNQKRQQKLKEITQQENLLYPDDKLCKQSSPMISFGYAQSTSYQTSVPPPNIYNTVIKSKKSFNISQNQFTTAKRNPPYGEQIKNPPVGRYDVNIKNSQIPIQFGKSERPGLQISPDSPGKYYNISQNIYERNRGFSFSNCFKELTRDKRPQPNKYNPQQIQSKRKIFMERSLRSELTKRSQLQTPSVGKYNIRKQSNNGIKFSKQKRIKTQTSQVPGPNHYQIKSCLNDILGKMKWKIPKPKQFITPSAQQYQIKPEAIHKKSRSGIIYYADRVDFSQSTTKQIGPGTYNITRNEQKSLGKMDKSERPKIKNQNPGPGKYNIPSTIGIIPKYYKNIKTKGVEKNKNRNKNKSQILSSYQLCKKNSQQTQQFEIHTK